MSKKKLVTEGKTKKIYLEPVGTALIVSKNDITAENGKKHNTIIGKAKWSTTTTCNVFKLLKREDVPTAFIKHINATTFRAQLCDMIPLEVVVRGEAHGSYLKRNPNVTRGKRFSNPISELYLKTSGKIWRDREFPCDDPLMKFNADDLALLYRPNDPDAITFAAIPVSDIIPSTTVEMVEILSLIKMHAENVFRILRHCWSVLGYTLVDLKIELGFTLSRELVIADVIDNDSWRLLDKYGNYVDKQVYRDGKVCPELLEKVAANSKLIAKLSTKL